MWKRRRLEVTIKRSEFTVMQSGEIPVLDYCPKCGSVVGMLPVQLAAKTAGVTPRTLYRWVEGNSVHYRESSDGTVLICERSFPTPRA